MACSSVFNLIRQTICDLRRATSHPGPAQADTAEPYATTLAPPFPIPTYRNSRENINILEIARQPPTEILEVCPVVAIEPIADLRRDIGQVKSLVHCLLRCFCSALQLVCEDAREAGHVLASAAGTMCPRSYPLLKSATPPSIPRTGTGYSRYTHSPSIAHGTWPAHQDPQRTVTDSYPPSPSAAPLSSEPQMT